MMMIIISDGLSTEAGKRKVTDLNMKSLAELKR